MVWNYCTITSLFTPTHVHYIHTLYTPAVALSFLPLSPDGELPVAAEGSPPLRHGQTSVGEGGGVAEAL